jgi:hypothetical protein
MLQANSQGAPIPALRRLPTNFGSVYLQMFTQEPSSSGYRIPVEVGTGSTRLVVLRGNSGSGKSSVAAEVRARYGRGIALVGQDYLRRIVLRERDAPGGANIGLIDTVARYALDHGFHVILDGILDSRRYAAMLEALRRDHCGVSCWYYLDVPFEETMLLLGSEALRQAVLVNRCSSEALSETLAMATGVAQVARMDLRQPLP